MTITPEYQEALLGLHDNYEWGYTGGMYAGETVLNLLQEFPEIETILDYGCGDGSLKKWIEEKGVTDKKWTLYDPGIPEYKNTPQGRFDLVITTDVLEHVEEIMLNKVLIQLRELTGRFLYNEIACYFTGTVFGGGPYPGQDLHLNVKAPDVWAKRLSHRDFSVEVCQPTLLEGWKVRCLVIQERIDRE